MKILIISVSDKRHMSMVSPYLDFVKVAKIRCDIIRVNRYEVDIPRKTQWEYGNIYEYPFCQSTEARKLSKILKFWRFRIYALSIIRENDYKFVVVWNENTAVLFGDFLMSRFKNKYCVNIRDFFEIDVLKPFYRTVVNHACFVTSPSPEGEIAKVKAKRIVLFNYDSFIATHAKKRTYIKKDGPICIVYMGLFSAAPKTFKQMVYYFGNDERFVVRFYGDGFKEHLGSYIDELGVNNVFLYGPFQYEKTVDILDKTDIIDGYYNTLGINKNLKYVAGVKQSYSPMLFIPSIVDKRTTWGAIAEKYGFAFTIDGDLTSHTPDVLYSWYKKIDFKLFSENCKTFNKIVHESREALFSILTSYISSNI